MLSVWYSDIYSAGIDEKARFPRQRYQLLHRMLQVLGTRIVVQESPKIDLLEHTEKTLTCNVLRAPC